MSADRGPGQALFELVRYWSRRSALDRPGAEPARLVLATEAVAALAARGGSASVGSIADELGVDQSGASRLVAAASDAGYLQARPASVDARRRELQVTAAGASVLEDAHAWQEGVFLTLTDGWSDARRTRFGRDLGDLIDRSVRRSDRE